MDRVMGAKQLESIPMAALFVETPTAPEPLPLWYVPPEFRRTSWTEPAAEDHFA